MLHISYVKLDRFASAFLHIEDFMRYLAQQVVQCEALPPVLGSIV